jgi:hypothetical protein
MGFVAGGDWVIVMGGVSAGEQFPIVRLALYKVLRRDLSFFASRSCGEGGI